MERRVSAREKLLRRKAWGDPGPRTRKNSTEKDLPRENGPIVVKKKCVQDYKGGKVGNNYPIEPANSNNSSRRSAGGSMKCGREVNAASSDGKSTGGLGAKTRD